MQPQNERCQLIKAHMSSVEITGEHFQSLEYLVQNVVLSVSLIWLHSLECRIDNKEMLQLEAYSGNMCVELFHVMNVGVDSLGDAQPA